MWDRELASLYPSNPTWDNVNSVKHIFWRSPLSHSILNPRALWFHCAIFLPTIRIESTTDITVFFIILKSMDLLAATRCRNKTRRFIWLKFRQMSSARIYYTIVNSYVSGIFYRYLLNHSHVSDSIPLNTSAHQNCSPELSKYRTLIHSVHAYSFLQVIHKAQGFLEGLAWPERLYANIKKIYTPMHKIGIFKF